MAESERNRRNRTTRVVLVGLLLLGLSWLADALVDAGFALHALPAAIFAPPPETLLLRSVCLLTELAFVVYIVVLLRRRERLERELEAALQRSAEEHARSEAILEALGDGISIQDTELRILYQNAAQRAIMGDHRGEYCYAAYQQRPSPCPDCHLLRCFADGRVHRRETATEHSAKGHLDVEVVSTPLRDGDGRIFAGIEAVRDITERKRTDATLRAIQADLERRTRELSAANAELEAFGSTLAHDIRSFLSRIATASEILGQLDGERLGEDGRFCVEAIASASSGMEQLIDSILTLSRVSHRELLQRPVNLSAVASEVAAKLAAGEPQRQVAWEIAPELSCVGDPGLLRIALENLLTNAWKYTRDADPARIAVTCEVRDGQRVLCVRDNGIGFDMADVDRLFRPFTRLTGSHSFAGHGIGLATVQRIVLRHGGSIRAEGSPGRGAAFFVSLPGEPSVPSQPGRPA